jgi:hypothetical protein
VGLIAHGLDQVKHRRFLGQLDRVVFPAFLNKFPLSWRSQPQPDSQPQIIQCRYRRRKLSFAAIDQDQIRQLSFILLEQTFVPAVNHFRMDAKSSGPLTLSTLNLR